MNTQFTSTHETTPPSQACPADFSRRRQFTEAEDPARAESGLSQLLIDHQTTAIEARPADAQAPLTIIIDTDLPIQPRPRNSTPHVRNGKIARLPKLQRDMVNRMLYNHVPYAEIVAALHECCIHVTQRNISNWRTRGGYAEWCAEQQRQLQLSRAQDHLTDYLRKNDAAQLPEVGLQVAATQLSLTLLQPETARQLAAEPEKYSKVVDMLCRLATHIKSLQKDRDEAVNQAAIRGTSEHLKRQDEEDIEALRYVYSSNTGTGSHDHDIHPRNELPRRDALPFRNPPPPPPELSEILASMRKSSRNRPSPARHSASDEGGSPLKKTPPYEIS